MTVGEVQIATQAVTSDYYIIDQKNSDYNHYNIRNGTTSIGFSSTVADAFKIVLEHSKKNGLYSISVRFSDLTITEEQPVVIDRNIRLSISGKLHLYDNLANTTVGTVFTITNGAKVTIDSSANIWAANLVEKTDGGTITFNQHNNISSNTGEISALIDLSDNDTFTYDGKGTYKNHDGELYINGNGGGNVEISNITTLASLENIKNITLDHARIDGKAYKQLENTIIAAENARISINATNLSDGIKPAKGAKIKIRRDETEDDYGISVKEFNYADMGDSADYPTVDLTKCLKLNAFVDTVVVVPEKVVTDASYKDRNWFEGASSEQLEKLVDRIKVKVVDDDGNESSKYALGPVVVGNYIRFIDKAIADARMQSGDITEARIQYSADDNRYTLRYKFADASINYAYFAVPAYGINDVMSALLSSDTTPGMKLTIGYDTVPIDEDITLNTGDDANAVFELYGSMTGKLSPAGSGTIKVKGSLPFEKLSVNADDMCKLDFTAVSIAADNTKKLTVWADFSNGSSDGVKLYTASKANYKSIADICAFGDSVTSAVFAFNNTEPVSKRTKTETWIYPDAGNAKVHTVSYYESLEKLVQNISLSTEFFSDGSYLNEHKLPDSASDSKGWKDTNTGKFADNSSTVTADMELYPGYDVNLDIEPASDIKSDSAVIKGMADTDASVYYTDNMSYNGAAGIINAVNNHAADVKDLDIDKSTGSFTLTLDGLSSGTSYSYRFVARRPNGDCSAVVPVSFRTAARAANAADFRIAETEFTYDGFDQTVSVLLSPDSPFSQADVDKNKFFRLKNENGNYSDIKLYDIYEAGIYGVFVNAKSRSDTVADAVDLYIGDITIYKAKLDKSWFELPVTNVIYENDDSYETLMPKLKDSRRGITGYGDLNYKLYIISSDSTDEASRNADGHYDVISGSYSIGITCTGGNNIEAQDTPLLLDDKITYRRADNAISIIIADMAYGGTPSPQVTADYDAGSAEFTYSRSRDDAAGYEPWSTQNPAGTWYVKASIKQSKNYNAATSEPTEFEVTRSRLMPYVVSGSVESKTYSGDNKVQGGLLKLKAADGYEITDADMAALSADDAVTGNFEWTSAAAGTNTVNISNISFSDSLSESIKNSYELDTTALTNIECGAGITNAAISNVNVSQSGELTYNGSAQRAAVTTTGTTVDGSSVAFIYALTEAELETNAKGDVPSFTDAGTHTVWYRASAANHDPVTGSFEIDINKAELKASDIIVTDYSCEYDGASHGISITLNGDAAGASVYYKDPESGQYTLTDSPEFKDHSDNPYIIEFEVRKNNYLPFKGSVRVKIDKRSLTISALPKEISYNDELPAFGYNISNIVDGEDENKIIDDSSAVYTCNYVKGSNVGSYTVTPSGFDVKDNNYIIDSYKAAELTVIRKAPVIRLTNTDALNRIYNAAKLEPQFDNSGDGALSYEILDTDGKRLSEAPANAGVYTVTAKTTAGTNYAEASESYGFEIKPAELRVIAEDKETIYKQAAPTFTYKIEGFAGNDTEGSALSGAVSFDCVYNAGDRADTYSITPKGPSANHGNYNISFEAGTLTVKKAEPTIGIVNITALSHIYNGERIEPVIATDSDNDGKTGFRIFDETGAELAEAPANAGMYKLIAYTDEGSNYNAGSNDFAFEISPAELTVAADSKQTAYGTPAPDFTYSVSGIVNNESPEAILDDSTLSYTCAYKVGDNVGEYDIIPLDMSIISINYVIKAYIPSKLTVEQAEPVIDISNIDELNRIYNTMAVSPVISTDSDGTLSYEMLDADGNTLSDAPVNAGSYTVNITTKAGTNYKAGERSFEFEIKRAPLRVIADDIKLTAGDDIPQYTVRYEGFAGNEDASVLSGSLDISCSYTKDSSSGSYEIIPSGLGSNNYDITFVNGSLTAEYKSSSSSDKDSKCGITAGAGSTSTVVNGNGSWIKDDKGWRYRLSDTANSFAAGTKETKADGSTAEYLNWLYIGNAWWPFGSDGYLKTGWVRDESGSWYYIDENAGMLRKWSLDHSDRHWYYLDPVSGKMLTGWQYINNKWYYLTPSAAQPSGIMGPETNKWVRPHPYGSMYMNEYTPDGYFVGADGAWIPYDYEDY